MELVATESQPRAYVRIEDAQETEPPSAAPPTVQNRSNGLKRVSSIPLSRGSSSRGVVTEVPEDQWSTIKSDLLFPVGPKKQAWDTMMLLLIVYSCADVPFRIGLGAPAEGMGLIFEFAVTAAFLTDIYLNFNTAYQEDDKFILDRKRIATNYLFGWFVIDALSSFPLELLEIMQTMLVGVAKEEEDIATPSNQIVRVLRLFRLVRLLRLAKLQEYMNIVEDNLRVNLQVLNLIKMVLFLVYLMHILGCFWFYIASNSSAETTWLSDYDGGSALTADKSVQYLYSVYWALMTLTTVGYGDIVATNNGERLYVLCTLLIGAIVFGYVLSSVGDLISNIDPNASAVDDKLKEVCELARSPA